MGTLMFGGQSMMGNDNSTAGNGPQRRIATRTFTKKGGKGKSKTVKNVSLSSSKDSSTTTTTTTAGDKKEEEEAGEGGGIGGSLMARRKAKAKAKAEAEAKQSADSGSSKSVVGGGKTVSGLQPNSMDGAPSGSESVFKARISQGLYVTLRNSMACIRLLIPDLLNPNQDNFEFDQSLEWIDMQMFGDLIKLISHCVKSLNDTLLMDQYESDGQHISMMCLMTQIALYLMANHLCVHEHSAHLGDMIQRCNNQLFHSSKLGVLEKSVKKLSTRVGEDRGKAGKGGKGVKAEGRGLKGEVMTEVMAVLTFTKFVSEKVDRLALLVE
eukprot:TRINITY_DN6737_c0_g2_i4.p2 TRINITY_DN6737_c0_g2~~TRINITY_DN6737_c0_g2_i4.p2  ORF type:complete len:325 (+),score=128.74 TRINITY_DN6737_c0_g2_i4:2571-3545(+)